MLLIILNLSFITLITSNSLGTSDYGSFNVQKNDSRQYRFASINLNGKNYIQTFETFQNGSQVAINLNLNDVLTVKVSQVNSSFVETKCYNTRTTTINMQDIIPTINFVKKAYENESAVQNSFNNSSGVSYDQNYLYYSVNSNFRNFISREYNFSINWHTGWLKYANYTYRNNQDNSYGQINLFMVPITPGITIGQIIILTIRIFLIIFIVLALIFIYTRRKYENYRRSENKEANYVDFIGFLLKKKKIVKKKEIRPKSSKPFEILDNTVTKSENEK